MPVRTALAALAAALLCLASTQAAQDDRRAERERMVANIAQLAAAGAATGSGRSRRLDPDVLLALRRTPRHLFVPQSQQSRAYTDGALHIGYEATISQPFIVALMTDLLDVERDDVVLEVGTGSGYQAAILSQLAGQVYSVEIVPQLAQRAAAQLKALGYNNVAVRAGDGYAGWPEHAPFDAIIVTAGATRIPAPLVRQLKPGGRMLIPVGASSRSQRLTLVRKDAHGRVRSERLLDVNFIPLVEPPR
ncbi:MAG: protein-L-isoaspartate(D-aspartate) O-methyltransferase [Proteobacteria bacterium]|nr:protein-L-isoaspartate(D-aspartate) O-methyltransferase [Pseudomonadota bacterium]MBW3617121.1 protein-L-isoaspartate(D-aspartate) O-methyltransferase [Pseudomonadota bacterium]